ncbi:sulfite exporter TauE/SafE family protein, partial [Candidatus Bathyarchaeota archaeon]|nr:sulfite exporter TauE/SafE family protein [Candidatus Bathyarchaeota archaeon]
ALSGTIGHLILGHIKLLELLALAPGIIAGTQLGASAARRAKSLTLRRIFSLALIVVAILLLMG